MDFEDFSKAYTKVEAENIEAFRSVTRRKSVMDPMWAAQRIIDLEETVQELRARIRDLEDEYIYHRPRPRGL